MRKRGGGDGEGEGEGGRKRLTFEQRQLLEFHILRVAIAGGALRLLGFFLQGSLSEGVYPVHKSP